MKKKGFTLIELIVVLIIIAVIAIIAIPFVTQSPNGKFYIGILVTLIIILAADFYFLEEFNYSTVGKVIAATITIIGTGLTAAIGYHMLSSHLTSGEIKSISWKYEIDIKEKYYSDGETKYRHSRTILTSGTDHEPYWGEYQLARNEKEGSRTKEYYFTIWDGKVLTTYTCGYDNWLKHDVGDSIEFEFQDLNNFITKIY